VVIRRRDQGRPSGTVAAFLNLVRESDPAADAHLLSPKSVPSPSGGGEGGG
jgi:hypothetical protein